EGFGKADIALGEDGPDKGQIMDDQLGFGPRLASQETQRPPVGQHHVEPALPEPGDDECSEAKACGKPVKLAEVAGANLEDHPVQTGHARFLRSSSCVSLSSWPGGFSTRARVVRLARCSGLS